MVVEMEKMIKVFYFYSYSSRDAELKNALMSQLHHKYVDHLDGVSPGKDQRGGIKKYIDMADIILLLISPDFLSSDYSSGQEMERALERHEQKEARVIPIILRPVDWENGTSFGGLPALPRGGQAVSTWRLREQVLYKIAKEIISVADEIRSKRCLDRAEEFIKNGQYEDALKAIEQAIQFDRKAPFPYEYKGDLLFHLKCFKEAFVSYSAALKIAPQNVRLLQSLGRTLAKLERYDEALATYKQASTAQSGSEH